MTNVPSAVALADGEAPTDAGNARRLVAFGRELFLYVPKWKSWHQWDGKRWAPDELRGIEQLAQEMVRHLYELAARVEDKDARAALVAHAKASEADTRIRAMIHLAESAPEFATRLADLDANPVLLNVLNGTLDLEAGVLRPHWRRDRITKLIPFAYDRDAPCPKWEAFVAAVTSGDAELGRYLQTIGGYCLTGDAGEQCWFFPYGDGGNGKTTYLETLRGVLSDYARQANVATFLSGGNQDKIREDIVRLAGARLVTAAEPGEDARWNESLIKRVTGDDTIAEREMWQKTIEFVPTFKLLIAGNHKPAVWDTSHGFWRRMRLIPFQYRIPKPHIKQYHKVLLAEEGAGILTWLVEGYRLWRSEGLGLPKAVLDATRQYQAQEDVLGEFIEACLRPAPGQLTDHPAIRTIYETFCKEAGAPTLGPKVFIARMREKGFVDRRANSKRSWVDVALQDGAGVS